MAVPAWCDSTSHASSKAVWVCQQRSPYSCNIQQCTKQGGELHECLHTSTLTYCRTSLTCHTVFNKISEQIEDGKRLENLSWRIWARESFCCQPESPPRRSWSFPRRKNSRSQQATEAVPELSSSVESSSSSVDEPVAPAADAPRPELRRAETSDGRRAKEKHITPIDLEKIVISIKEKKELEPLSPLPLFPSSTALAPPTSHPEESTPRMASPSRHPVTESSTSTIATATLSSLSDMSPTAGSDTSASSEMSSTSVVRGFTPGKLSTSTRSSSNMAPPAPILKNSSTRNLVANAAQPRKAKFMLGGSEGDDSSLESRYLQSSVTSDNFRPANMRKVTSFKDTVTTYPAAKASESDSAIESESAIETDDEDEGWEDEDEEEETTATSATIDEKEYFHKADIEPRKVNLPSRPSLISLALEHGKRTDSTLLNSRSTPALRRSRTSTPNGPSLAASPEDETVLEMKGAPIQRIQPIIMTTSNTVQAPSTSPRTTRRLMLQQELPESLRKHMVWERQQRNKTNAAALKRRHTAHGPLKDLKNYPGTEPKFNPSFSNLAEPTGTWNAYFDAGNEQEYHSKGW